MMSIDFEQVFARLPSPYMVLDENLNFVVVNKEYERATMRPAGEYIGHYVFDKFPNEGDSGRRLRDSFEHVLKTGKSDTIAYLPYDIPRPPEQGGGMERRFWSCRHVPLTDDEGTVRFIVQNTVDVTEIAQLREAASLPFSVIDGESGLAAGQAREAEAHKDALLAENEDFRRLFQDAPSFVAVVSGPRHVFTFANNSYVKLIGGRSVIGMTVGEALPEIAGQGFYEMLDKVYETGEPAGGQSVRLFLQRSPNEEPRETFLDFSYDAIRNRQGQITGVFVQGMDRTEAVRTLQRQRLLLDELNHRVKNTLASVQSLAAQTFRYSDDPKASIRTFEARLKALSKAHDLLSASEWSSASLRELVLGEFSAADTSRVSIRGPAVTLGPKAAIAMAMVLHELTTNALRFGALSGPSGTVVVSWDRRKEDNHLILEWCETDGPAVKEPARSGFGTRMIERVVLGELAGTYVAEFTPAGFCCTISIPGAIVDAPD